MFKHKLKNRVSALAMSGFLAVSSLTALAPSVPAYAAGGTLSIDVVDADPYGAQAVDRYEAGKSITADFTNNVQINDPADYWHGSNVKYRDFMYTPQGLGTFATRYLRIYDLTELNITVPAGQGAQDRGYVRYSDHKNVFDNKDNYKVMTIKNGHVNYTDTAGIFTNGHKYLLIEDFGENASGKYAYGPYGYYPNVETQASNAWQAIFEWDDTKDIQISWNEDTLATTDPTWYNYPLGDVITRGGFSYKLYDKDLQAYESQGEAELDDPVFAIYNINSHANGWSSSSVSTAGYIIADRNNDGTFSRTEQNTFIPAYSEKEIMDAADAYFKDLKTKTSETKYLESFRNDEFIIGNVSRGGTQKAIMPAMLLTGKDIDTDGNIKVNEKALPVGTYMIVQVKAGTGYYLDEDFRPIVHIGVNYTAGLGDCYTNQGLFKVETGYANDATKTDNIVAWIPAAKSTALDTLSKTNTRYEINTNHEAVKKAASDASVTAEYDGTPRASYGQSDGNYIGTTRLAPKLASSKLIAHDTIIRAGGSFKIADADDVKNPVKDLNIDSNGYYIIEAQGNGDLDVAKFNITNTSKNKVVVDGTAYEPGSVVATMTTTKANASLVTDALPFGNYTIEQTAFGEGYKKGDAEYTDIEVAEEDKLAFTGTGTMATIKDVEYVPNQLVKGGELYTIKTTTGTGQEEVGLKVYNISDHYVYVDNKRYETSQSIYESDLKGKELTMEQVKAALAGQIPCKEITATPSQAYSLMSSLPYGTYLIAVDSIPDDYTITGDTFGTGSVTEEGEIVKFTTTIEKTSTIAVIDTEALDASYGIDSLRCAKDVVISDKVNGSNLTPTQKYRLYGVLVDKDTKAMVEEVAIATGTIEGYKSTKADDATDKAKEGTGEATLMFDPMDLSKAENRTFVVYEYLVPYTDEPSAEILGAVSISDIESKLGDSIIAKHNDFYDEDQTVRTAGLDITAKASYTGGKEIDPSETVKGTISVSNLEIGNKYHIDAFLYDESNTRIKGEDGNDLKVTKTFTASATTYNMEALFEGLDPAEYNGQRLTVYADLYRDYTNEAGTATDCLLISKGDADSMGYDITSEDPGPNQVDVVVPVVKTVFATEDGEKTADLTDTVKLVDTITYSNLIVGGKYRAKLTVVDREGNALLDDDGNEISGKVEFTADKAKMNVSVPVEFYAPKLDGSTLVAFNDLYRLTSQSVTKVAEEHDTNATDQMLKPDYEIVEPTISTVALDSTNNSHSLACSTTATITETIKYAGFDENQKYKVVTTVADAATGNVIEQIEPIETMIETKDITDGTVKVSISLNSSVFEGKALVVYDEVYDKNGKKLLIDHKDKTDANQTVYVTSLSTTATGEDGSSKTIPVAKDAVVVDKVNYYGLTPGTTYKVHAELVTESGASVAEKDMDITAKAISGSFSVRFEVDTTELAGEKLIATETLTDSYTLMQIVVHDDLTDLKQTVTVEKKDDKTTEKKDEPTTETPTTDTKTGTPSSDSSTNTIQTGVDQTWPIMFVLAGIFLVMSVAGIIVYRKRGKRS